VYWMQSWADWLFFEHPRRAGETYLQHLFQASRISVMLLGAALAAAVHGVVPRAFECTASNAARRIVRDVDTRLADGTGGHGGYAQDGEAFQAGGGSPAKSEHTVDGGGKRA